jgi:hypothetical protein
MRKKIPFLTSVHTQNKVMQDSLLGTWNNAVPVAGRKLELALDSIRNREMAIRNIRRVNEDLRKHGVVMGPAEEVLRCARH